MMLFHAGIAALFAQLCLAIYADEAGVVDYHLQLLGLPSNQSTFFHPPVVGSKASLLYTLSNKSVLGAIKPKDGSVVWRQRLSQNITTLPGHLVAGDGQNTLLAAVGSKVTAWTAADGRFEWETSLPDGQVVDLQRIEIPGAKDTAASKDAVVVVAGKHTVVYRLDAATGAVRWSYEVAR